MEFKIEITGPAPDPRVIEDAIRAVDPAALVDIDPDGQALRVAALVGTHELVELITQAGYRVDSAQVRQLPSTCCGGCSG
jgi:hypothetical protein